MVPASANGRRAADADALARLVRRAVLIDLGRTLLGRTDIDGPHLVSELARREPAGQGDPPSFVLGLRHAADEAHLRPGERAGDERGLDGGQPRQLRVHPREVLERARGEAEALHRVVAQAREAEALLAARGHEAPGQRSEHTPQRAA